jgi:23S rRNA U2552 (ribose-2'-O)-methylase RlmE/FtsJ
MHTHTDEGTSKFDVVLSDMAPATSGVKEVDVAGQHALAMMALKGGVALHTEMSVSLCVCACA